MKAPRPAEASLGYTRAVLVTPSEVCMSRVGLVLVVAALALFSGPAWAVEGEGGAPEETGPAPGIDEIGTQNEVSGQHLPEAAEPPPFMRFLYVPLVVAGIVISLVLLLMYLAWQPRFAEERRSKRRR